VPVSGKRPASRPSGPHRYRKRRTCRQSGRTCAKAPGPAAAPVDRGVSNAPAAPTGSNEVFGDEAAAHERDKKLHAHANATPPTMASTVVPPSVVMNPMM
jgi:hypothetical protein